MTLYPTTILLHTTTTPPARTPGERRELALVFLALCTGTLLAALDQTIVSTALPTIVGELGGLDHLSWVVTSYLLTATASTPLYGKISDLYGRKIVFQTAITIFLVGSLLCGVAQDLPQLIVFRGIQGVGGGGLMAMAFAIIADVVSPRERGRYVGVLGSVFAIASVAGPLLGGFFVDNASWRWVFTVNIPIGIVAMVVTQRYLHLPARRVRHRIDLEGAALLVAGVSSLLLGLVWGGDEYGWSSPTTLGMLAVGVALTGAFIAWERHAEEPLLPLRVFSSPVISLSSLMLFIIGCAMFGGIVFLPLFLQVSTGASATTSGLLLLPLMAGIMGASITSGRLISRTGRYKVWPITGMALAAAGMLLLTRLEPDTPRWESSLYMLVVGVGIGLVMQTLMLAAQNASAPSDLGVVSSATMFFRSMGGSFGVAIFGAVFASRLATELPARVPMEALAGTDVQSLLNSPEAIRALDAPVRAGVVDAVTASVHSVFLLAVPLLLVGFALAWFLRELPLRDTTGTPEPAPAPAEPHTDIAAEPAVVD
jgi:EmrB/QacA subfamily drug resistance transporter